MQKLPDYLTNHPFQKLNSLEVDAETLSFKNQIENIQNLNKKERSELILYLTQRGFYFEDLLKNEGFWCSSEDENSLFKNLPFPKPGEMTQDEINEFVPKLKSLEKKSNSIRYMGYSKCRLCGKLNGTSTIYNDTFAWPEGLSHYIEEHGVKPSAAFTLHVRGLIR